MFCKKCGTEIKDGEKFCSKCGAPAETDAAPVAKKEEPAKHETPMFVGILLGAISLVFGLSALGIIMGGHISYFVPAVSVVTGIIGYVLAKEKAGRLLSLVGLSLGALCIVTLIVLTIVVNIVKASGGTWTWGSWQYNNSYYF
jgi:hypothetical protein